MKRLYEEFREYIDNSKNVAIFSHIRPDGDSIGSSFALDLLLKKLGKNSQVFFRDDIPDVYKFLPGINSLKTLNKFKKDDFDLIFVLDISEISRLGIDEELLADKTILCIDHHATNAGFATLNMLDPDKAATALILWEFISHIYRNYMDEEIAQCMLTGIITDTGGFKYSNTDSDVFSAVGALTEYFKEYNKLMSRLYESYPIRKFDLIKRAYSNSKRDGVVMYSYITVEDLEKSACGQQDTDGIVNKFLVYEGVEIAFLIMAIDEDNQKISIRSKGLDISKVAVNFGGGGHKVAAGLSMTGDMFKNTDRILDYIKENILG